MVVKMNNRELRQFVNSQADDSRKHDALYEAYERIRQLEKQCAGLAAEIDRMQPVITMAQRWNNAEYGSNTETMLAMRLSEVVNTYEASNPK